MSSSQQDPAGKPEKVNFLHITEKSCDHRYFAYNQMQYPKPEFSFRKLYWIGIIDTNLADFNQGPISFVGRDLKLRYDACSNRDVDGASMEGKSEYNFNLKPFQEELKEALIKGLKHYHVFLEEIVEDDGEHSVYALHLDGNPKGMACEKPWVDMPTHFFMYLAQTDVSLNPKIRKDLILHEEPYKWMK